MNIIMRSLVLSLLCYSAGQCAEPVAKQFLRYIYGADGIEITTISLPSDDVWMLRGSKNPRALAALDALKIASKPTGVTSGLVGTDIYFVETRNGRVDPAFNLEGIYALHRQAVLRFIYFALAHDRGELRGLVTDVLKVEFDGPKAAPGDMEQYGSIIEMMPVVRSSVPADDATRRTVTYRVPLGEQLLMLTFIKDGSTWKIDTSTTFRVPLEFFFSER